MNLCSYKIVKTGLHIVLLGPVRSAVVWGIDYVLRFISKTQNCVVVMGLSSSVSVSISYVQTPRD
jgi:hypothetical protein